MNDPQHLLSRSLAPAMLAAGAFVALLAIAQPSRALEIALPRETAAFAPSPLPGYALAQGLCATCHSAEYAFTQPAMPRAYWQATVVKMQKTFGAPIPDTAINPIVDYLTKTYGNERGGANAPTAAATEKKS